MIVALIIAQGVVSAASTAPTDGGVPVSAAQVQATVNASVTASVNSAVSSAVTSATPAPCGVALADTLNGTAGSATVCTPRADRTRPTAVQRAIVTTDATGSWSVTWAKSFTTQPVIILKPIMPSASKGDCGVMTSTVTGASGTCWTYQSTVVSILGASVSPIATAAAGVSVMVVGAQPTQ